ncbi:MAG: class I SAM-dependent methyltransferase [bacterium]|nr:class I SAM-dependent methyltransferase [bacterium]
MLDLASISNLSVDEHGVWTAAHAESLFFPKDGNRRRQEFEPDSFWYAHRNRALAGVLDLLPPGGTLLDVGGGNGTVSLYLESRGYETVLLEPEREGAQFALDQGLPMVACATLEAAEFRESSFAGAGLFDVLEHVEDERAFLERLASILKPGGRLYLTVPAFPSLWSQADERSGHFRRYRLRYLLAVVRASGLRPLFSSYFFAPLVAPVWLMRSLPHRMGWPSPQDRDGRRYHRRRQSKAARMLEPLLNREIRTLRKGGRVPFGTSCLTVAERPIG